MPSTPKQGLSGKARRARDLTRSHRMYSQQLIEEYLDWESGEESPERHIPIKRSSAFLPSADVPGSTSPDDSGAGQFEFDHTKQEPIIDRSTECRIGGTHAEAESPPSAEEELIESTVVVASPAATPVVAPAPVATVVVQPEVIRPRRARINILDELTPAPAMSTNGFLVGCGLGGGAALILLLIAGWLIG